jgi:heme exporter protein B
MSNAAASAPALGDGFVAVVRRDLLLAWKRPGDVLNPLIFFAIVSTLFPLAVGPGAAELALIGPGVVWVAALLAALLSLNSLYLGDYEDGSLEQWLLSPQPLPLLTLAKCIAHWLQSGLPLVILSPLVALSFRMSADTAQVMMLTLALGTLSLSLLGSIGAALTVGLNRGNALLSLLILPLAMPILIFGTRAVSLAAAGDAAGSGVYLLGAYCMLALALGPFAAAAALRISNE